MLEEQSGLCAICNQPETAKKPKSQEPRRLAVDHCHLTNKIRGLLCNACNSRIGILDDDEMLSKALTYLEKHNFA